MYHSILRKFAFIMGISVFACVHSIIVRSEAEIDNSKSTHIASIDSPRWVGTLEQWIHLGASDRQIEDKVGQVLMRVRKDYFLEQYPFKDLLTYTNSQVVTEWKTQAKQSDGWPGILFCVFSDTTKTNLIDAFWFREQSLTTIVDGGYSHNLRAIKKGLSVETLYELVGKRQCDYFIAKDNKWRVRFTYWSYGGRIFVIEADAAQGRVIYASDGTL